MKNTYFITRSTSSTKNRNFL